MLSLVQLLASCNLLYLYLYIYYISLFIFISYDTFVLSIILVLSYILL